MKFASFVNWVKPRIRYVTRLIAFAAFAIVALRYFAVFFAKEFPEAVAHYLHLTFQEAIVIAMFMILIERVVIVQDLLEIHLNQTRDLLCHKNRDAAYQDLQDIIRPRSNLVTRVDLIQFSGSTALPLLHCLAKNCPSAQVRLLLYDRELAGSFDDPGFHSARITHTLTVVKTLRDENPNLKMDVWFYSSSPSLAGVIVDNWAASVGWYRVFPNENVAAKVTLKGHSEPTVNAFDSAVEPLHSMVERQMTVLLKNARPIEWKSAGEGDGVRYTLAVPGEVIRQRV